MISDTGFVVDRNRDVWKWTGTTDALHTFRRVANMAEAIIIPDDSMERYGLRALYVAEDQPPTIIEMLDEIAGRMKAYEIDEAAGKAIVASCNAVIRIAQGRPRR